MNNIEPYIIDSLYSNIKNILEEAKKKAFKSVNIVMVEAYWEIGRVILEEEQNGKERAEYGKYLIKELSKRLTKDLGKGFDQRNLWYMKSFYINFPKVNAVRSELTWTHYRLLKNLLEMEDKLGGSDDPDIPLTS